MKCGTKKMAYGGMATPMQPKKPMAMMAKGGMAKKKPGYAKGGMAMCGASMPPAQKGKK
jgi:hypothetical protein